MIRTFLVIWLMLHTVAWADLDVTVDKLHVITGVTNPKVINDIVFFDKNQNIKVTPAAKITVVTDYKFIKVKARTSIFEVSKVEKISNNEYVIVGSGKHAVEITVFDPNKGIDEESLLVDLGDTPPSPGPTPNPNPTPSPIPDDEFDNLGKRVFSLGKDLPKKKDVASLYLEAAKTLTEDPATTINTVTSALTEKRTRVISTEASLYAPLIDMLNTDLKNRWPMSRVEFARYLQIIGQALQS